MRIIVQHIISYINIKKEDIETSSFITECRSMRYAMTFFDKLVNSFLEDEHEYHEIWDFEAKIYWWDKHKLRTKYPSSCSDIFLLIVDEEWNKYKPIPFEDYSQK